MGFSYFPHTAADIGEMLKRIGVDGLDDLYADVPRSVIFDGDYDLPDAMSEMEVRRRFEELDRKNRHLTIMAGVLVTSVKPIGIVEDLSGFAEAAHAQKALLMVYADPSALAVVRTPGEWGADVACGDAQTLGIPLGFGGPYVGFLACSKEHVRKLPGRIVGATTDVDGKRAFVLTLQAREQHIRREKANSNICSNQSLMALYVTIYLSLMGKKGLRQVCDLSYGAAHYLHDRLIETGLFSEAFNRPFLKEFALHTDIPADRLQQALLDGGFFGALPTEEGLVTFCATERRTREEIDRMIDLIKQIQL